MGYRPTLIYIFLSLMLFCPVGSKLAVSGNFNPTSVPILTKLYTDSYFTSFTRRTAQPKIRLDCVSSLNTFGVTFPSKRKIVLV